MSIHNLKQIQRGDIYFANLSPAAGAEQSGVRPVLVIQNDIGNRHSPTIITAAITGYMKGGHQPTHVRLKGAACGLFQDSTVLLEQLRTLQPKNANIDYCGIRNLLRLLVGQGFTEAELKKIAARIAQEIGATIIFC